MKELLEYMVNAILDEGDFEITESEDNGQIIFEIKVKPESTGLLIGKGGQTIKSIQNVVSVRARKENKQVYVKVS